MLNTNVPLNGKLSARNLPKELFGIFKTDCDTGLLQARRAVTLYWKSMDAPSLDSGLTKFQAV